MKALTVSTGMREGSRNAINVLRALPSFFERRNKAYMRSNVIADERARSYHTYDEFSSQYCTMENVCFWVSFLRQLGLVAQTTDPTMACSPDAVCTLMGERRRNFAAVEVKTMTAVKKISEAKSISRKFGQIVIIDNIGRSADSGKLFQSLISNADYRAQCIHHAFVLRANFVIFVVSQGGSSANGGIIFLCILHFDQQLLQTYSNCLNAIREFAFSWITDDLPRVPMEYDKLCTESYASDLEIFVNNFT